MAAADQVQRSGTYFITAVCAERRPIFQVDRNASLLFDVLQHYRTHYKLHAFVIMPDHVHLLLTPTGVAMERCLQLIKGGYSYRYHKELGGSRSVWQRRFQDHRCRDRQDYLQHMHYIEQNPVSAGLVTSSADYRWSSAVGSVASLSGAQLPDRNAEQLPTGSP